MRSTSTTQKTKLGARWIAPLVAAGLVLTSCTSPSPISPPSETVSPPETADLSGQKATSSTTIESTTTEPTATEPTMEEAIAEIEDFMQTVRATWRECSAIPQDCDAKATLSEVLDGEMLDYAMDRMNQRVEDGLEARPPLDEQNDRYIIESVELANPIADSATVTYCVIDGVIIVKPEAAPDGSDLIVNDAIGVIRRKADLERPEGAGWRMHFTTDLQRFADTDGCGQ